MYKIKIEKFQGPLDLLLQLIEQHKMEITEISIGQVTDQYIEHIEKIANLDPEELSDFLVLAARLLLMKSKAILPILEDEEDVDDLEKQLKIYKEFLDASKDIEAIIRQGRFSYSREKPPLEIKAEFSPAKNITAENLRQAFMSVLKRLDPIVKMPRQMIEKTASLQQKMIFLKDFLAKGQKLGFKSLINDAKSKTEVIMNFLALLELSKQQYLTMSQDKLFDDIVIEKIK